MANLTKVSRSLNFHILDYFNQIVMFDFTSQETRQQMATIRRNVHTSITGIYQHSINKEVIASPFRINDNKLLPFTTLIKCR